MDAHRRLWNLRLRPQNRFCADCYADGPGFGSIAHGVLVCGPCAEVHSKLGGAALIKKLSDPNAWEDAELKELERIGNDESNAKFEALPDPDMVRPFCNSTEEERTVWIRAKYQEQRFVTPADEKESRRIQKKIRRNKESTGHATRLVDAFVLIGRGGPASYATGASETPTVLNTVYTPTVSDHYPKSLSADEEAIPKGFSTFAFPAGLQLLADAHTPPTPRLHRFVLTKVDGANLHGVCLTVYQKLNSLHLVRLGAEVAEHRKALVMQDSKSQAHKLVTHLDYDSMHVWTPMALCVLSHWPFMEFFEMFLTTLYRISLSSPPLPLERFVLNFTREVPVPPMGRTRVQYSIGDKVLHAARTPPNQLPAIHADSSLLFRCFSMDKVVQLVAAVVTEQKLVLVSDNYALLYHISETLMALVWPFRWVGVYMPLLPRALCDFLWAPVPFVAGIHSSYLSQIDLPDDDLVLAYINEDRIDVQSNARLPDLPKGVRHKLADKLKPFCARMYDPHAEVVMSCDLAYPPHNPLVPVSQYGTEGGIRNEQKEEQDHHQLDADVRQAFVRVFVKLFLNYTDYLTPMDDSKFEMAGDGRPKVLFQREEFLKSMPDDTREFLAAMMDTQLFNSFVDERWVPRTYKEYKQGHKGRRRSQKGSTAGVTAASNAALETSSSAAAVRLFSEFIAAKRNRSKLSAKKETPFLNDHSFDVRDTFVSVMVNGDGIARARYQYAGGFPNQLQEDKLGIPRFVKPLVNVHVRKQTVVSDEAAVVSAGGGPREVDYKAAIVKIQATWRMHCVRQKYVADKRVRDAHRAEALSSSVVVLQAAVRAAMGVRRTESSIKLKKIVLLQKFGRGICVRAKNRRSVLEAVDQLQMRLLREGGGKGSAAHRALFWARVTSDTRRLPYTVRARLEREVKLRSSLSSSPPSLADTEQLYEAIKASTEAQRARWYAWTGVVGSKKKKRRLAAFLAADGKATHNSEHADACARVVVSLMHASKDCAQGAFLRGTHLALELRDQRHAGNILHDLSVFFLYNR